MKPTGKIRVGVLFGGRSAEHEVSLQSAANVIQHLDPHLFEVTPIGIDKQGAWFVGNDVFQKSLANNQVSPTHSDALTWFNPTWASSQDRELMTANTSQTSLKSTAFDVIFPVVHGTLCEDGTLQGLLELADIPYVGCGVLSSAIGMDKDVAKRLAMAAGIPIAPYLVVKKAQWQRNPAMIAQQVAETLTYPLFVKPANTGSSIGITKVKSSPELANAINVAFQYDVKILIEKALNARELELAVLESLDEAADPLVSVVGEIKPNHEFYSYAAKYTDAKGADLSIPAAISADLQQKAQQLAKTLFQLLECTGMARVDLFLERESGQLYFNEINTIPGFTKISMYPKLMGASGVSYQQLLTHLIKLAINQHQQKSQIRYNINEAGLTAKAE